MMNSSRRRRPLIAFIAILGGCLAGAWPARSQNPAIQHSLIIHAGSVTSVAFSPDGKTLASGSTDESVKLWDVASGKILANFGPQELGVSCVAFSPDGKLLAAGSKERSISLWEVATQKPVGNFTGHSGLVYSVAFSPDGRVLASGSQDKMVMLWEVATRKRVSTFDYSQKGAVRSVAFSPDGKTLAAGGVRSIKLWNIASGKNIATLEGHRSPVNSVVFSPEGKTLASAAGSFGKDSEAWFEVKLWDVVSGENLFSSEGIGGVFVAFSPAGNTFATAGVPPKTERPVKSNAPVGNGKRAGPLPALATIKLWDLATRKPVAALQGHTDNVLCANFSPDGKLLASGSSDKTIRLWDVSKINATGVPGFKQQEQKKLKVNDTLPGVEVLGNADAFRKEDGEEQVFHGVLKKVAPPRDAKASRFNPYRLESSMVVEKTYEEKITIQKGNEIQIIPVTKTVETVTTVSREIYVADKAGVVDPYLGKTIKLTGKLIKMQADGQTREELWPARIEVFQGQVVNGRYIESSPARNGKTGGRLP